MTFPSVLLGCLFCLLYGFAFHWWRGGGFLQLLFFQLMSWSGFWIGHIISSLLGWNFVKIGPLHWGLATLGAALFLFLGNWLNQPKKKVGK